MKHVGIEIKFYHLDTFKKQIDVNFIDLDSELVDLNYKVASLIFCHFWRSIVFCDMDSEPGFVWALIQSFSCQKPLTFSEDNGSE